MSDKPFFGQDLTLGFVMNEDGHSVAGPYTRIDLLAEQEGTSSRVTDLGVVGGTENLVQSLIMRLMTQRGELQELGHPNYGSRHHELIGEPNSERNRNLIKLYVLECLQQEPRLEAIERIDVRPGVGLINRDKVEIRVTARAKNAPDPLILDVPFSFEEAFS